MAPRRGVRSVRLLGATLLVAVTAVRCNNDGGGRITGISATGTVVGFVARDANGSRVMDQGDDSVPGAKVRLVLQGRQDTGLVQTAQANGFFRFRDVPVGVYALTVDTLGFADTLQIVRIDSTSFTVAAADTVHINALVGLPVVSVRQARTLLPAGRRVFVVGVALSPATAFADSTASVADSSGSIRLANVRASFATGDSMRVQGVTDRRGGQPMLDAEAVIPVGKGLVPAAAMLTAATAASAAGGARDAQLVQVRGAIISDTARTTASYILTASDGSGSLEIQLDRTADASFQPAALPADYVPGNKFDVTGVLVPTGTGTWRLRPRSAADLAEIPLPVISVATARLLPAGRTAVVVGVALNGSTTYADSSVFLADGSGAIRLTQLRASVAAGDSVRVRGTTARRAGQPTLDGGTATALGRGFFPAAATLTTAAAATAAGGARDAQMVLVHGAIISDTARTTTSYVLTASDSSGPLEIQLDRTADASFQPAALPADYVPGNKFDVTGVLVPTGTGTWRLRPRSAADLAEIPLPVISIATARSLLPAGQTVVVVGVALNASTTFADSTVFLADTSGAIRLTQLRASVLAGDSLRVRARTSSRGGQPTLNGGTTTALGPGFSPTAATLTTAAAAGAAGGTRDAQLVVVRGMIVSDTARTSTSYVLTASDGSGSLEVQLDRTADANFQPAALPADYVPGNKFDVVGVLAPTGTGTWRLRPRSAVDLTEIPLPVLSIAAARSLPAGSNAIVVGVALNGSGTFSDTTVYLADTSGAIRLTRLRTTVAAGDSVKVRATTAVRTGQPTLDGGTSMALGRGFYPAAATLTTAAAAAADGGTRDAQMVVVTGATISDTARVRGDFKLTVSDGSGNLEVLLDHSADPAFQAAALPGVFVPGNRFDLIGVLQPVSAGVWRLKPRSAADLKKL